MANDGLIAEVGRTFYAESQDSATAALLAHCFNHFQKLVEILDEQIEQDDLVEDTWICRWCGREYDTYSRRCPSDDCPGHQLRQTLAEAKEVQV